MEKTHSTNYQNSFIQASADTKADKGIAPLPKSGQQTVASLQFEMIFENPYQYTSDEVMFEVHSIKQEIPAHEKELERQRFFSKGQPCLRCSPLVKSYGWGIHHNEQGKVALYPINSPEYLHFSSDSGLQQIKGMKSSR
ncbi:MAG: hypothetical protein IPH88_16330 [Bacteroidales bacterium]|nr:hypothetical protein [Bacteroidales bacterium]